MKIEEIPKNDMTSESLSLKEIDIFDDEKKEEIYNQADKYCENKFSDEIINEYVENYGEDSLSFFDKKNIENLKKMSISKRIAFLSRVSGYLNISPQMMKEYYSYFPEDFEAVKIIYENNFGSAEDGLDINLFSVSAIELYDNDPTIRERHSQFDQYLEMSRRREIAPDKILSGMELSHNAYKNIFGKFGKAADGFGKVLDEASSLSFDGDHIINADQMFTSEYEEMTEEKKAEFLRHCIDTLHYHLLFDEAFNSCFDKDMVEKDKQRMMENIKQYGSSSHNVAHSMIFKTYQPNSVYSESQEKLDYTMNSTAMCGGAVEEYANHRIILAVLNKLKDIKSDKEKNVDKVVDLWNKNRNPIFGNAVSDVLSEQDPERAASELLRLIKEEKDDKNSLSAILYRLEFGKIGISEEGVGYLERMYDLGEYNNPDYHVSRLTADGEIGIFDEDLKLMKYFHLGDLSTEEKKVQAKVMDFVYETLFYNKSDESPEDRIKRERYLKDFKENYYKIANEKIFEQTGVRMNNLSFKEQGGFVVYYGQSSEKRKEELKGFVQKYGEQGIKTFLSLESGQEMGEVILNIGERADSNEADVVFAKYAEIVSLTEKSRGELEDLFRNEKKLSDEELEKIVQNLVSKAGQILIKFSEKFGEENSTEDLLQELEEYRADLILTASVYKGVNQDEVSFEDLEDVEFESKNVNSLSESEIKDMKDIYARNYEYNPKFQRAILDNFDNIIKEEKTKIYFYKDKGKIVAFNRFDDIGEARKYFGSFNVDPVLNSSSIGSALMEIGLEKEVRDNEIEADCIPKTLISTKYIGRCGFVARKMDINYKETDVALLGIIRSEENKKYQYINHTNQELIADYENSEQKDNSNSDKFILKFEIGSKELIDKQSELLNENGFVMSNYVFSKDGKYAYCAFEKES